MGSSFEGGNIRCVSSHDCATAPGVQLAIQEDPYTELEKRAFKQWFYFQVDGPISGATAHFTIINGGEASSRNRLYTYLRGLRNVGGDIEPWPDSDVVYSYDRKEWRRCLDTSCDQSSGHLSWSLQAEADRVWFAYFAPYPSERHVKLLEMCEASSEASVVEFGRSLDDQPLHVAVLGRGPLKCWVIHRQHPGETMGGWFAEGLVSRLVDPELGDASEPSMLLDTFTFFVVPNLNPDGSVRGHLRTNAAGSNLNREWADTQEGGRVYKAPTLERSPEVYWAMQKMDEVGCDVFVDVHGDETVPYNFISGMEGCPNWGPRLQGLQGMFTAAYSRANADMQVPISYEPDEPGLANMAICSNQIAVRYDCLSVTLEQPFKDCLSNSDPIHGWSPERSKKLGGDLLEALAHTAPYLRSSKPFWNALSPEDQYVRPSE